MEPTISRILWVNTLGPDQQELLEAYWQHVRLGGETYVFVRKLTWDTDTREPSHIYQGSNTQADDDWHQLKE